MKRPDLHLHTTASDGVLTPAELARMLQRADATCFAITDHDTLAGLGEAAQAAYDRGLAFIPGVEISTEGEQEVHILGYGVRQSDAVLLSFFHSIEEERIQRIRAMGTKLAQMGFDLPVQDIIASAGNSVGRPHLARAMLKMGYISTVQEAFEKYIGSGCPAYVPRARQSAAQVIRLLRERQAVPVLAHPGLLKWPMERLLPLLDVWQEAGLMGLEVYHPAHRGDYARWDRLARQRGLLVTGGSDFHDRDDRHGQIGETAAEWPNACEDAWALFQVARR